MQLFFRNLIKLILRLTCKIEVIGLENIPGKGKCILAANHLGRFDALLVYDLLPRTDIILTPAEKYQKVAFFRLAAKSLDAVWLDRFNPDVVAIRAIMQRLDAGQLFAVAPEGTRSQNEALIEGQPGTAYLAYKTGAPLIPVALTGTEDRLVKANLRKLRRSTVHVTIGKAIDLPPFDRHDRETTLKKATDEIMCQIAALLPPRYHGVYADHPRLNAILLR